MSDFHQSKLHLLKAWLKAGVDFFLPPRCPGCGRTGYIWCPDCHSQLKRVGRTGCRKCGLWHDSSRCLTSGSHPLQIRSYARYAPPLTKAILELKYRPNRPLAAVMGGWLIELYADAGWSLDAVVPVPLAFVRKQQRGYNQVELIASSFAEALDLPLDRNTLLRVRDTGSQVGLDHVARRSNLEGAFRAEPQSCVDKTLLVIDDLLTSGATMMGCAEALFAAGAAEVYGLTVASAARGDWRLSLM